jgi:acetoin utilization deacetylase AcuC-like enzyme
MYLLLYHPWMLWPYYGLVIVILMAIILLLFQRVLYVGIDVHHGNCVEEAFFATN